ncbi:MAG: hypothetical protein IJ272_01565 [Clostridia bacterium]|nr:hypothetical protein [Clostridia bacterium]
MGKIPEKEIIIKKLDIRYGVEKAEEIANDIIKMGYTLVSATTGGSETGQLTKLILVFKKNYI